VQGLQHVSFVRLQWRSFVRTCSRKAEGGNYRIEQGLDKFIPPGDGLPTTHVHGLDGIIAAHMDSVIVHEIKYSTS
jgi:hypothetical protein